MGRESRKARYLSEIGSARELKEAMRELELREFFARERLAEDAADTFTLGNLISTVMPRGSVADRVVGGVMGGVGTGFSALQSVIGVLGSFMGSRGSRRGKPTVDAAVRRPATRAIVHKKSAVGHTAPHPASHKSNSEIEVEVTLSPEPKPKSAPKRRTPAVRSKKE